MVHGFDAIALTLLDVLDDFDEIRISTSYPCRGESLQDIPYGGNVLAESEPVYDTLPGWKVTTSRTTNFDELPPAAKDYIRRVEELCGAPVALISTGADRTETIIKEGSTVSAWMK